MSPQPQILIIVLTHTVVYKSTYHAKPRSIYFLPQYQRQRKYIGTQMKRNKTFVLLTYISADFTVPRVLHHQFRWEVGKCRAQEAHGGSWVQIPSGARIFPTSQWVPSAISSHIYHSHICSFSEK